MKKIILLIITFLILITGCIESKKEKKEIPVTVEKPEKTNNIGKISNLKNGCNFNNSTTENNINIFLPNEKELYELKSITNFSGLPLNFKIYRADINNAIATIINDERYILYDSKLLDYTNNQTQTFWSSISILAHEIGHHLSGHTLNQLNDNHKAELEADKFSGFTLYKMGASKEQAIKAIETIGSETETKSHPSKSKRIIAIKNGWEDAYIQDYYSAIPPPLKEDPNQFYEYTMEMLYDSEFLEFYSRDYFEKYDFMYGVVMDRELDAGTNIESVNIEIIKTGKIYENENKKIDRQNIKLLVQYGQDMCNACWKNFKYLLKPGRRVKFAFNEGHPSGGSMYNGMFNLSYIKAIPNDYLDFYSRSSNSNGINKIINDFLIAEENRNLNDILSYYSTNIKKYWNINYPSKMELAKQYENAWKYSKNAQNIVNNITKVNSNTYILDTNFRFYDIKKNEYRYINSKVKFIFDDNNKIIETNGI